MATAAAAGFGARVYSVFNTYTMNRDKVRARTHALCSPPLFSPPLPQNCNLRQRYAYHGLDFELATQDEGPQGRRIRRWFAEFAAEGDVADWRRADSGSGVGIITNVVGNDAVHSERAFKADLCALWRKHGAGAEFWW